MVGRPAALNEPRPGQRAPRWKSNLRQKEARPVNQDGLRRLDPKQGDPLARIIRGVRNLITVRGRIQPQAPSSGVARAPPSPVDCIPPAPVSPMADGASRRPLLPIGSRA